MYQLASLFFCLFLLLSSSRPATAEIMNDPHRIFRDHYQAVGGLERLKQIRTTSSEGRVRYDGLEGTFKSWSETPLRYRLEENYGIVNEVEGDDGLIRWRRDTNGQVENIRDEQTLKRRRIAALLEQFAHLDPDSPIFDLAFEGHAEVDGQDCYVVRMSNTINNDVTRYFFRVQDLRVIKTIDRQPDIEILTRYDDYRPVDGCAIPFHQESHILPRNKKKEVFLTHYRIDPPVDRSLFAIPPPATGAIRFPAGDRAENIPFRFIENLIYLPVTIGDDTRLWVLDSGASMSVIDADYAASLGLSVQGSIGGFGFGDLFQLAFVRLSPYRVGAMDMPAQTIHAFKGLSAASYEPVRAGILGFDFLSHFVTRIDYARQTVSFYRPEGFAYNGPGVVLDAPLKYRTFSVPVRIDDFPTARFSLDLGSHRSSFHHPYAQRHNLLGRQGVETVSRGMAGFSFERIVPFTTLTLGGYTLDRPLLTVPPEAGPGSTSVGELAGILGNSLLRHFVLYLDYPKQQVIVEKGANFDRRFAEDKSGMLVGLAESGQPMVSFVAIGTPAAEAGFIAGDRIEAVDGRDAADYGGVVPIRKLLREKAGTRYRFTVRRQEQLLTVPIELRDLF
ncbi:MAG: hypothetical protein A2X84_04370 [Desulfuromonadaceae bacterium GWC2_58_13]|nr:MAG: hypothetical protein A2X84_04370 [Desulfuromonadaceae bacterium GWC2_58_13]